MTGWTFSLVPIFNCTKHERNPPLYISPFFAWFDFCASTSKALIHPFSILTSQNAEGAHLSWEAPSNAAGNVSEYSVYLAIRSQSTNQSEADKPVAGLTSTSSTPVQLAFVRVYCGAQATCTVSTATLQSAHIDFSTKPAIIFRIAAKNDKG